MKLNASKSIVFQKGGPIKDFSFFSYARDKNIDCYEGGDYMSTIKSVLGDCLSSFAISAFGVIGMFAGITVWSSGLGDLVEEKTKELFKK